MQLAILFVISNQSMAQEIFRISPATFDTILFSNNTSNNSYRLWSTMENLTDSLIQIEWLVEDVNIPSEWTLMVADNETEFQPSVTMSPSPFELNGFESNANFFVFISSFGFSGCGTFKLSYRNFLTQEIIQTVNYSIGIDDENCLMTSTVQQSIPNFSISPNPTSDLIRLSTIEGIETVEIFDTNGKLIKSIDQIKSPIIDLNLLSNGLYIIKVEDSLKRVRSIEIVKN